MLAFVIGVNHRTASLPLRGCVAFATEQAKEGLKSLRSRFPTQGFVLLSTCNRTELYGTLSGNGPSARDCLLALLDKRTFDTEELSASLYERQGIEAMVHLFRAPHRTNTIY